MRYEVLIVFILGILFISVLMPILDAIGTWVVNIFNLKIVEMQVEAEEVKAEVVDDGPKHAIGFQYENEEDDEWEDDEDE